jgi:hypothetical protein
VSTTTIRSDPPAADLQEVTTTRADVEAAFRTGPFGWIVARTSTGRKTARLLGTIPVLCAELDQLRARLASALIDLHNLVAAARATLGAHADGERDALYYLRDELEAQGQLPPDGRERR